MQFRNFDDIKSGKDKKDQPPMKSIEDERIYSADAELRYLITMYTSLICAENTKNNEILIFLDKLNVPKYEYKNLKNYIPEIDFHEYNNRYNYIKTNATNNSEKTSVESVFQFIIHNLAYFIITIAEHKNTDDEKLFVKSFCLEFSKLIITNIIKNQKLLSKPLLFNWACIVPSTWNIN
jgi:asparagine N-glycosylation enzyme membrane subunit Stt3